MSKIVLVNIYVAAMGGGSEFTAEYVWKDGTLEEVLQHAMSPEALEAHGYRPIVPDRTRVTGIEIFDNDLPSPDEDQAASQTVKTIAHLHDEVSTIGHKIRLLRNTTPTDWNQISALETTKENLEATLAILSRKYLSKE